jgi:glycosyltransferase involved in cell wall biosynthesis
MKIVILVYRFPPKWLAGTEIASYNLAMQLAKRGHEVYVITSRDDGLPGFSQDNGFNVHRVIWPRTRILGNPLFWFKIVLKTRSLKPDLVHAQDLSMGLPAWLIKKILKIPYIVWGRGSDVYLQGRFGKLITRVVLKNADAILVLTEDMRKQLHKISNAEISVIPNGIDLEKYSKVAENLPKEAGRKNILFVGTLYPVKGVRYLIMAMKIVHDALPEARLILVGDGEERGQLTILTNQLGISDCVQFVGKVPHNDVQTFLYKADIFVLPSLSEGFPNVILEAMACGLPIVASRVGGVPDIMKDGVHGYLVEAKEPDKIAEKILILLNNNELREKIAQMNKDIVKTFGWDNVIHKLEFLYKEISKDTE